MILAFGPQLIFERLLRLGNQRASLAIKDPHEWSSLEPQEAGSKSCRGFDFMMFNHWKPLKTAGANKQPRHQHIISITLFEIRKTLHHWELHRPPNLWWSIQPKPTKRQDQLTKYLGHGDSVQGMLHRIQHGRLDLHVFGPFLLRGQMSQVGHSGHIVFIFTLHTIGIAAPETWSVTQATCRQMVSVPYTCGSSLQMFEAKKDPLKWLFWTGDWQWLVRFPSFCLLVSRKIPWKPTGLHGRTSREVRDSVQSSECCHLLMMISSALAASRSAWDLLDQDHHPGSKQLSHLLHHSRRALPTFSYLLHMLLHLVSSLPPSNLSSFLRLHAYWGPLGYDLLAHRAGSSVFAPL